MREASYRWECVTEKAAFAPRDGAGALVFKNRMWLIGGWNSKDKANFPKICANDVWSSSDGVEWRREKPNTFDAASFDAQNDWEGRHCAGYAVYRDRLWIVGGDCNQLHYQFDVWNSADGRNWHWVNRAAPVPWGPRILHHTLVFDDKIWIMGGQTTSGFAPPEAFYNDIWNSSDGVHWARVETKGDIWSPRGMIGGNIIFQDRIWILGGGTYDTPKHPRRDFYNDVWSSADGVHWERHLEHAPWSPRQYHDVAVFDGKMWVMEGGYFDVDKPRIGSANRNDVWYSSDGVNWRELPDTPWKPRHAASVFVHDDALWMVTGNNMESDVWKLRRVATESLE